MPAVAKPKAASRKPVARAPARMRLKPGEKARIEQIFERFAAAVDEPSTELQYQDPFTLVVAGQVSPQERTDFADALEAAIRSARSERYPT